MTIVNLTQHAASADQLSEGVFNLSDEVRAALSTALTFTSIPSKKDIENKAAEIVNIATASGATSAMIGGAPYLMPALAQALKDAGIKPLFAYTDRVSVDEELPDGSVRKTAVFVHRGFVEAA